MSTSDLDLRPASGAGGGAPTDAAYVVTSAHASLSAEKVLGADVVMAGTDAGKPAAAIAGRLYYATDSGVVYRDTGSAWEKTSAREWAALDGKPATFPPSAHGHVRTDISDFDHASRHENGGADALPSLPSPGQKNALAGTAGTPGSTNQYVTNQDGRLSDARTPLAHTHAQPDVTNLVADLAAKQASSEKGQANGYASLDATGKVPSAQLPPPSGGPSTVKLSADNATITVTTLTNISGLSFSLSSGSYYRFEFWIVYRNSTAGVGLKCSVTFPAVTRFASQACIGGHGTADGTDAEWTGSITSSGDAVTATGLQAVNTDYLAVVEGMIVPSANGALQFQAACEVAGNLIVRQGSAGFLETL